MKVFISWSGEQSHAVAEAISGWLPLVINDEGLRWIRFDEWRRRQPRCTRQDREAYLRQRKAEQVEKPLRRRRTA